MMSDVPFGVFLSGGVDSSANVALMSRHMDRPVETFSVGFKGHDDYNELDYARLVAKQFGAHHHEVLIDDRTTCSTTFRSSYYQQDEPIADWVCVPLYYVSKLARDNGVIVVQVGEGSDELFCGYDHYRVPLDLQRQVRKSRWACCNASPAPRGGARLARLAGRVVSEHWTRRAAKSPSASSAGEEIFWGGAIVLTAARSSDEVWNGCNAPCASRRIPDFLPASRTARSTPNAVVHHLAAALPAGEPGRRLLPGDALSWNCASGFPSCC